ncbi:hypothetical protein ACFVTC_18525 [Streptomyces sp. NPDC057950]|uniref:hypothetical protein n=1 Tax=Streptomyces sp. NPDC057950 TaxID=3346288 RepID=UPI0036E663AB
MLLHVTDWTVSRSAPITRFWLVPIAPMVTRGTILGWEETAVSPGDEVQVDTADPPFATAVPEQKRPSVVAQTNNALPEPTLAVAVPAWPGRSLVDIVARRADLALSITVSRAAVEAFGEAVRAAAVDAVEPGAFAPDDWPPLVQAAAESSATPVNAKPVNPYRSLFMVPPTSQAMPSA